MCAVGIAGSGNAIFLQNAAQAGSAGAGALDWTLGEVNAGLAGRLGAVWSVHCGCIPLSGTMEQTGGSAEPEAGARSTDGCECECECEFECEFECEYE